MKIQIIDTGEILTLDNTLNIPNLRPFRVLNNDEISLNTDEISSSSRIFRVDSNFNVLEVPDNTEQAIQDSRQARIDRICSNGGRYQSKQIDLTKLNTDALDGVLIASREMQQIRIENNNKSR